MGSACSTMSTDGHCSYHKIFRRIIKFDCIFYRKQNEQQHLSRWVLLVAQ